MTLSRSSPRSPLGSPKRGSRHTPGSPSRLHGAHAKFSPKMICTMSPISPKEMALEDWALNEYEGVGVGELDDEEAREVFQQAKRREQEAEVAVQEQGEVVTLALEQTWGGELPHVLRELLNSRWERVINIFKAWDDDGNGCVDREEFVNGLQVLGIHAHKAEVDAFFQVFDPDGSGALDFRELSAALRKHTAQAQLGRTARATRQPASPAILARCPAAPSHARRPSPPRLGCDRSPRPSCPRPTPRCRSTPSILARPRSWTRRS